MNERNILVHELLTMMRDLARAVRVDYVVRSDTQGVDEMDRVIGLLEGLKERAEGVRSASKEGNAKEATTSIQAVPPKPESGWKVTKITRGEPREVKGFSGGIRKR